MPYWNEPRSFLVWGALNSSGTEYVCSSSSIKQCHLLQPRKHTFSVTAPACWKKAARDLCGSHPMM